MRPVRDGSSPRPGRSTLIVGAVVIAAAAALSAGLLVGSSAPQPGTAPGSWPKAPLASSFVTSSGSWAVLPMGHLSDPLNTFWQVFFRPVGESDWRLVTPPGVADNGGIAASPGPGRSVAMVFAPSQDLTFSPFAITSDDGSSWSPGVIPFGVARVPDVLSASLPAGAHLSALASGGSAVMLGTGNSSNWATVLTKSRLAGSSAAASCGLGELTALSSSGSDDLLGSNCTRPGVVGIFLTGGNTEGARSLQLVGPKLASSEGDVSVLRLSAQEGRIVALVDARKGSLDSLYALWGGEQASGWSVSQAYPLAASASVVSTGFGPDGTLVVETKSAAGDLDAAVTATDGAWRNLPKLPTFTESVSVGAGGTVDALGASLSQFTDWQLVGGQWQRTEVLTVPIQYGSSS